MRGRQVVWSDEEVQNLAKRFITVAEEVYWLDPEYSGHKQQVANNADYRFFQAFGRQVPREHWNEGGTRQGIYVIGPGAEYLGARFASPDRYEVRKMLREALQRWNELREKRPYNPQPIPRVDTTITWPDRQAAAGLLLRVNSRDLPRRPGGEEGRRFHQVTAPEAHWGDFRKWAWNQSWFELNREEAKQMLPGTSERQIPTPISSKLLRESFVDNVRGQVDNWTDAEVKEARLTARPAGRTGNLERIRLSGKFHAENSHRGIELTLAGDATFDHASGRFVKFHAAAIGERWGIGTFNNRSGDGARAPIGYALVIEGQPE